MFKYADENQVQIYHEFCSARLNQLKQYFSNEFNIQTKFQLIGSGSKKLVTQNNNLPFDLDYNFEKYDWNPIPESKEIFERLKELKSDGYWKDIKELYLNKKNMYLKRNEKRCSFEIFVETINEIWFQ